MGIKETKNTGIFQDEVRRFTAAGISMPLDFKNSPAPLVVVSPGRCLGGGGLSGSQIVTLPLKQLLGELK